MKAQLRAALVFVLFMSLATGIVYPLVVTGIAQLAFPKHAAGSLVSRNGQVVGSVLIGQPFSGAGYFWSRPSATTPMPYNAMSSGGSNLGPTNPALIDAVRARVLALKAAGDAEGPVPVDLVTASASGLDPDESVDAALYQVTRVAHARHLPVDKVRDLVNAHAEGPELGFLGQARVNVLLLNLALDQLGATR